MSTGMMKSAKLPPAPKTDLQLQLGMVENNDSLKTISTLTRNIAQNPREDKYRKIRLTNAKINQLIMESTGALGVLQVMGWVEGDEEGFLVLPNNVQMSMAIVRAIDEALVILEKAQLKAQKARMAARNAKSDPLKAELLAQLEADKRERATVAPVTEGSKATERAPKNIMTAGDLGIGSSSGG